jgi:hypothetical protein
VAQPPSAGNLAWSFSTTKNRKGIGTAATIVSNQSTIINPAASARPKAFSTAKYAKYAKGFLAQSSIINNQ